ncbi:alpha-(1,3)-fucosyltransferase C-like [Plutella xylostella]|uniref:alpha-(1,3)-fucosyltransferase C-like n=1 Tax=Plutella xylostella TaxID=51655 RepID=UPI00203295CE|nr:alpha-(1,3)-fucosyltransferase C-like [Plutella xylostella]
MCRSLVGMTFISNKIVFNVLLLCVTVTALFVTYYLRANLCLYPESRRYQAQFLTTAENHQLNNLSNKRTTQDSRLKYILLWTDAETPPFEYLRRPPRGQQGFINRKCPFTNCFVTGDRKYLSDYTQFDVVVFTGPQLNYHANQPLPTHRRPEQIYAFLSLESSQYYPLCHSKYNNYFNMSWTYKLDSDLKGYIVVRDTQNNIIGPNVAMHWMELKYMTPISEELKTKLQKKSKAAAWFVSNCNSRSNREEYVRQLQSELEKYSLSVDVYGRCGPLKCSTRKAEKCKKMVDEDYYFYLSFENSFDEDYVTEKLLTALNYNAVPIVYGAANYTRFLPNGTYLNAMDLKPADIAAEMNRLIHNLTDYFDYFRWHNHYSYSNRGSHADSDPYCGLCTLLNDEQFVTRRHTIEDFTHWWNGPSRCHR